MDDINIQFNYGDQSGVYTEQELQNNENIKKKIIIALQKDSEASFLEPPYQIRQNGRVYRPSETFLCSLLLNPLVQTIRAVAQFEGRKPHIDTADEPQNFEILKNYILRIQKDADGKDIGLSHYTSQFVEYKDKPHQVLQHCVISVLDKVPYQIRRQNQFFHSREVIFPWQVVMACNCVFKTSYNEVVTRKFNTQYLIEQIDKNLHHIYQKFELFYLQRLNYNLIHNYPEQYVGPYLSALRERYGVQLRPDAYRLMFKIVQTTQLILLVQPPIICQFCLLEALLMHGYNTTRRELYSGTSHYNELLLCRRYMFLFGQPVVDEDAHERMMPLNGKALDLAGYVAFLRSVFAGIVVER